MKTINIPKILFIGSILFLIIGLSFGSGLYSGRYRNWVYFFITEIRDDVKLVFHTAANSLESLPIDFLQAARYEGAGVTINAPNNNKNELIFMSGFFENNNELRLIRRSGEIVARWPVSYFELFPAPSPLKHPPATDWNVDIHGAVALPDGSVIFNFEYAGLVKLNKCGDTVWTLPIPSHHSIEIAEGGGVWVPGRKFYDRGQLSPFPPFHSPLQEDTILKVSTEGRVVSEISVPELFYANNLESLLTSTGEQKCKNCDWDNEIVHLNKIAELKRDIADDFPLFQVGDLVISLRNYNLLVVLDPNTKKIKWWKIGPWIRQHDPEFISGGKLTVFNNNVYDDDPANNALFSRNTSPFSNIIKIDPVTNEHEIIYGTSNGQDFLSKIRGKQDSLPNKELLITEFEGGRVFQVNTDGDVIWEYINRYDEKHVAEITGAHVYPINYFNITDWSCNNYNEN